VADVGCGLAWFLAEHESLRVDQAECVNDDFALYGLYGVNDDGDGAGSELFKGLLSVDIDAREPAAKTGMRVVPAYDCLWAVGNVSAEVEENAIAAQTHKTYRPV